jgi:hypothetical protein
LDRLIAFVVYATGASEVAYDASRWLPMYSNSTVSQAGAAVVLTVRRNGGWAQSPTLYVHANTNLGGVN